MASIHPRLVKVVKFPNGPIAPGFQLKVSWMLINPDIPQLPENIDQEYNLLISQNKDDIYHDDICFEASEEDESYIEKINSLRKHLTESLKFAGPRSADRRAVRACREKF